MFLLKVTEKNVFYPTYRLFTSLTVLGMNMDNGLLRFRELMT
jgi:hypothetical protein